MQTTQLLCELDYDNPENIYISTYMKSGTTWLEMILYQMTSGGAMDFVHINHIIPWIEHRNTRSGNIELKGKRRTFKTHIPYRYFPNRFKGKIICVVRNGMDVAVSKFHHLRDYGNPELTFDELFRKHFINGWFKYLKPWLENKNNYNVLYIKYEDLKSDLEKEVLRIADFCNITIDEKEFPRIIQRSSFDFMKKYEDKFGMETYRYNYSNFIRKGESNKGQDYFNDTQRSIYSKQFDKYLSKFDLTKDYDSD